MSLPEASDNLLTCKEAGLRKRARTYACIAYPKQTVELGCRSAPYSGICGIGAGQWKRIPWYEISNAPTGPGVYAWYYKPEITTFDLQKITSRINELRRAEGKSEAKKAVRDFLEDSLFRYLTKQPYTASLTGPLKPNYEGTTAHIPNVSDTLLERIVESPERLETMRKILHISALSLPVHYISGCLDTSIDHQRRRAVQSPLLVNAQLARRIGRPFEAHSR